MEAAAAVKSTAFQPLLCFYPCFLISISSLFSFFLYISVHRRLLACGAEGGMSCVYAGTQRKQNTMKGICIYGAVIRRGKKKKKK